MILGCYCYSIICGHTVVHVFIEHAHKCCCGSRTLRTELVQ